MPNEQVTEKLSERILQAITQKFNQRRRDFIDNEPNVASLFFRVKLDRKTKEILFVNMSSEIE